MSDIFISYAREDHERARSIAKVLEGVGWSVWWDRRILVGKHFRQVIQDALDSARCVVVLWSRASIASDWVAGEAAEGKDRNILVPVLIEEVRIPLEFRQLQAARLDQWGGLTPGPDLDRLLSSISEILGTPAQRQEPGQPQPTLGPPDPRWRHVLIGRVARSLSRRRVAIGLICTLAVSAIMLVIIRMRVTETPGSASPSLIESAQTTARSNEEYVDTTLSAAEPVDVSPLRRYKIDVYYDEDAPPDRLAAERVRDILSEHVQGSRVILAPRPLTFVVPIVPPSSYEVRYDPPYEREAVAALVKLLDEHDSNWGVRAVPSWSQTDDVLSVLLFSRSRPDIGDAEHGPR